ncbi:MAG: hypothetical protein AAFV07_00560 [Bacteroidota bacterium]
MHRQTVSLRQKGVMALTGVVALSALLFLVPRIDGPAPPASHVEIIPLDETVSGAGTERQLPLYLVEAELREQKQPSLEAKTKVKLLHQIEDLEQRIAQHGDDSDFPRKVYGERLRAAKAAVNMLEAEVR